MRYYRNYREKLVALFPLILDLAETTFHNPLSNLSIEYHSLIRLEILLSLECFAGYGQNYDTQLHRQQQYNTPDSAIKYMIIDGYYTNLVVKKIGSNLRMLVGIDLPHPLPQLC